MIHSFAMVTGVLVFLVTLLFLKWFFLRVGRRPSHGDSLMTLWLAFIALFFTLAMFQLNSPSEFWPGYGFVCFAMFIAILAYAFREAYTQKIPA